MNKDSSIFTSHLAEALFTIETKRHSIAEIGSSLLDIDRLNEFILQCKQHLPIIIHCLFLLVCLDLH